jgi:hypothetical protein
VIVIVMRVAEFRRTAEEKSQLDHLPRGSRVSDTIAVPGTLPGWAVLFLFPLSPGYISSNTEADTIGIVSS